MHPAPQATPARHSQRLFVVLLWAALLLLVPVMTRSLVWAHDNHLLPLKPRDYTLLLLAATFVLVLLNRPALCLPALVLLIVPGLRVLDAAMLQRFHVTVLGDHSVFVMGILSMLLVSFSAVFCLSVAQWQKLARCVALASILVAAGSVYYEWFGFESFSRIPGRMSGFAGDPNDAPILICLMLGILYTLEPRFWRNMLLTAFATPAVALTLSRSGTAILVALAVPYVLLHGRKHLIKLLLVALLVMPLAIGGIAVVGERAGTQGVLKDENTAGRMQAIFELDFDRLKSPERAKDLADGLEGVGKEPIFGHGTGAGSGWWQPHNQVVALWLDLGLAGVLLFVGPLLLLTVRSLQCRLRGIFCLIPLWLYVPCSQILVEMPHYWLCAGVCCGVLFHKRYVLRLTRPQPAASHALPGHFYHS